MPTVQNTLQHLLDENARFALDARGTTNHCPMALVALARMGATPRRLQAFFAQWTEKYAILETQPGMAIAGDDWLAQVGQPAAFSSLSRHFAEAIERDGVSAVIFQVMSRAPHAPATGAFHAIIRVGYGIEAGHAGEIAAGLAAYVATNLPIDVDCDERRAALSVEEGFARMSSQLAGRDWPSVRSPAASRQSQPTRHSGRGCNRLRPAPACSTIWRVRRLRCIGKRRTSPSFTW